MVALDDALPPHRGPTDRRAGAPQLKHETGQKGLPDGTAWGIARFRRSEIAFGLRTEEAPRECGSARFLFHPHACAVEARSSRLSELGFRLSGETTRLFSYHSLSRVYAKNKKGKAGNEAGVSVREMNGWLVNGIVPFSVVASTRFIGDLPRFTNFLSFEAWSKSRKAVVKRVVGLSRRRTR